MSEALAQNGIKPFMCRDLAVSRKGINAVNH